MRTTFYRALDRPLSIIGLKGRWIGRFLAYAGGALLLGIAVGMATGSGLGISTVFIGVFAAFFWCLAGQQKVSSRRLAKEPLRSSMHVRLRRRETLSRTLLHREVETSKSNMP